MQIICIKNSYFKQCIIVYKILLSLVNQNNIIASKKKTDFVIE